MAEADYLEGHAFGYHEGFTDGGKQCKRERAFQAQQIVDLQAEIQELKSRLEVFQKDTLTFTDLKVLATQKDPNAPTLLNE